MAKLKLTLIKSAAGRLATHKSTIECLGLKRINQSVVKEVNPSLLGMINKVNYLLEVEEINE